MLILRGVKQWDKRCDTMLREIREFITAWDRDQHTDSRPLKVVIEKTA